MPHFKLLIQTRYVFDPNNHYYYYNYNYQYLIPDLIDSRSN